MNERSDSSLPIPTERAGTAHGETRSAEPPRHPPPRRASTPNVLLVLLALMALAIAAWALWRVQALEHSRGEFTTALQSDVSTRLAGLNQTVEQRKHDADSLRARLGDIDGVNRSVREELLAIGERSRRLEDAVANLAEQRLSARDALAMNEAEFLLLQARERLDLFADAQAAIAAYGLADAALAITEDPELAAIRQTVSAERAALEASRPADTRSALDALERLRNGAVDWPRARVDRAVADTAPGWRRFLARFVTIRQRDESPDLVLRDHALLTQLVGLDLRTAEAALFARDQAAWTSALARARSGIEQSHDTAAEPVRAALAEIERLAAQPFAPKLPELGTALKELRNLRTTRALAMPAVPASAPASQPPPPLPAPVAPAVVPDVESPSPPPAAPPASHPADHGVDRP